MREPRTASARRARRSWVRSLVVPSSLLALWVASGAVTGPMEVGRWADRNLLDGRAKDAWNFVRWHEDWRTAQPLRNDLDRSWMVWTGPLPMRIGHALGASGGAAQNRLAAIHPAWDDGIRRFEVDVWLDGEGRLRCHHGPPDPQRFAAGDCILDDVATRVAALGGWVVLDIKSDFEATGRRVTEMARATGTASRLIFQLYAPAHLTLFNGWASQAPFCEPIVTAYASHRRVQHIADELSRLRVTAFTVPIETLPSLKHMPDGTHLLVHPVHDCTAWHEALQHGSWGVYTLTGLRCAGIGST